jgi:hypothetical protein
MKRGSTLLAFIGLCLQCQCSIANDFDYKDCIKLAAQPDGEASFVNVCIERINVSFCVDNVDSAVPCSSNAIGVTVFEPGASHTVPRYAATGAGPIYWAVCLYPEAAVEWKPGPDNRFICRKTCVMC